MSGSLDDAPRRIAYDQIVLGAKITMGLTLLAVAVSIHLQRITVAISNQTLDFGLAVMFAAYVGIGLYFFADGLSKAKEKYGPKKSAKEDSNTNKSTDPADPSPNRNTGQNWYQRNAWRLQIITMCIVAGSLIVASLSLFTSSNILNTANQSLDKATKSLEAATRPSSLIVEILSETNNSFNNDLQIYRVGGPPDRSSDVIRVNIWNTGAQVAQNVTVAFDFKPESSTFYDIHKTQRCRDLVCIDDGSPVTIRAIEPNGFYTVIAEVDIFRSNIIQANSTVTLDIRIENGSTDEVMTFPYTVEVS